jgi:hypothetical protein
MFIQDELKIPEQSGLYNIEESGPSVAPSIAVNLTSSFDPKRTFAEGLGDDEMVGILNFHLFDPIINVTCRTCPWITKGARQYFMEIDVRSNIV